MSEGISREMGMSVDEKHREIHDEDMQLVVESLGELIERVEKLEGLERAAEGLEALVARVGMLEGRVEALRLLLVPLLK